MAQRPGAVSAEIDERDVLLAIRLRLPQVASTVWSETRCGRHPKVHLGVESLAAAGWPAAGHDGARAEGSATGAAR